ncbi:HPr(Ser) kinase/phosphatase [candidate division KSB1 bacterium 4572_119]|nr:MAG: HPr(Ser) kinase/phosphatase [candidate division KSB1 bacterium 4572_119]
MDELTVKELIENIKNLLQIEVLNDNEGINKIIREREIHRPGLALSGFVDVFTFQRIQIIGNTELAYLETLTPVKRELSLSKLFEFDIPCLLITENNHPGEDFIKLADKRNIIILRSVYSTTHVSQILSSYLEKRFAPYTTKHGSLVDVYGIGMLITGRSGIGKSEVALDLVERGHRLVADDSVNLFRRTEGVLLGSCTETLRHHMEIRGLGIIDIRSIFGVRAIRFQKRVEVELNLIDLKEGENYDRTGLDEKHVEYLGVKIPIIHLPVFPGKNITVIAETIAMNQLLKIHGIFSAQEFNERVIQKMQGNTRLRDYLFFDLE